MSIVEIVADHVVFFDHRLNQIGEMRLERSQPEVLPRFYMIIASKRKDHLFEIRKNLD